MKKSILSVGIIMIFINSIQAQLLINGTYPPTDSGAFQLVEKLVGEGVTISNIHFCGTPKTAGTNSNFGTFSNAQNLIGIGSGIVLSTGTLIDLPSNNGNCSYDWATASGDTQLNTIVDVHPAYDPIGLCFDFVPESNFIEFKYVFGSDEYPEYIGTGVNDAFGFFISGSNPQGGYYDWVNIALLSNGQPVTIDNAPFINNSNIDSIPIECDGYTNVMTASKAVNSCQTYQMKIILCDVGDHIIDTWVFLEGRSFTSPSIDNIEVSFLSLIDSNNVLTEACDEVKFGFILSAVTPYSQIIPLALSGTAVYGTDFITNPPLGGSSPNFYITIPQGVLHCEFTVIPVADYLSEGTETIDMTVQLESCYPKFVDYHIDVVDYPLFDYSLNSSSGSVC